MNQKRSRKQQIAIRSFTYGVMSLAVLVGAAFSLAWAMGFRFDFESRQVSQVTLLQLGSFPTGADIDINDRRLSSRTPARTNIKSGQVTVNMSRDGYRPWSKTVEALPSTVRWLTYARLVPENVQTESIKNFDQVDQMIASPDGRWLLIHTTPNSRELTLADTNDPRKIQFSTLTIDPIQVATPTEDQAESFAIVEWDQGSRYILLKHVIGETTEFLRLDRKNPTETKNLTRDFNLNIREPHFSGTSGNVFFALTDTDLRRFDFSGGTVSAPLVSHVQNYRAYKNGRLAYVSLEIKDEQVKQTVGIYDDGQVQVIKTYAEEASMIAEFKEYNNNYYLAVARGEAVAIYLNPLDTSNKSLPIVLSSPGGINLMSFSPTGRFVMAAHENKIVSYDIETDEGYSFEFGENVGALNWIDDFHTVDISGGSISLVEFDGANRQRIVSGRTTAVLSTNGKFLFSLSDAAGGVVFQRSKMVID
ncbi:PEGA domain-containing protein [Candidatus Saccharibacteria bacterium]|nr:PEGA domain-containing protein [Candidatus Saccharibacteria bacterium]